MHTLVISSYNIIQYLYSICCIFNYIFSIKKTKSWGWMWPFLFCFVLHFHFALYQVHASWFEFDHFLYALYYFPVWLGQKKNRLISQDFVCKYICPGTLLDWDITTWSYTLPNRETQHINLIHSTTSNTICYWTYLLRQNPLFDSNRTYLSNCKNKIKLKAVPKSPDLLGDHQNQQTCGEKNLKIRK